MKQEGWSKAAVPWCLAKAQGSLEPPTHAPLPHRRSECSAVPVLRADAPGDSKRTEPSASTGSHAGFRGRPTEESGTGAGTRPARSDPAANRDVVQSAAGAGGFVPTGTEAPAAASGAGLGRGGHPTWTNGDARRAAGVGPGVRRRAGQRRRQ